MAYFNLGVVTDEQGEVETSIGHYEQALRIDPAYRDPLLNLAVVLRRIGRYEAALEPYRRVQELDPRNSDAWLGEAVCLGAIGRSAEALERLDTDGPDPKGPDSKRRGAHPSADAKP